MVDEVDSGLDVDAIRIVGNAINKLRDETNMSIIVVSHYQRFLELVRPQYTHVLVDGRIVMEGDGDLAGKIDSEGYDWIYKELNIQPAAKEEARKQAVSLGACAVNRSLGREG